MARRKELRSVCNDLCDSFVSRNNDLDGYWALGKFQAHLQASSQARLQIDLVDDTASLRAFPTTQASYTRALYRHLAARGLPDAWVQAAVIRVTRTSPVQLTCAVDLTDDRGRTFASQQTVAAHPHDPTRWSRRAVKHGPRNRKGP